MGKSSERKGGRGVKQFKPMENVEKMHSFIFSRMGAPLSGKQRSKRDLT